MGFVKIRIPCLCLKVTKQQAIIYHGIKIKKSQRGSEDHEKEVDYNCNWIVDGIDIVTAGNEYTVGIQLDKN